MSGVPQRLPLVTNSMTMEREKEAKNLRDVSIFSDDLAEEGKKRRKKKGKGGRGGRIRPALWGLPLFIPLPLKLQRPPIQGGGREKREKKKGKCQTTRH